MNPSTVVCLIKRRRRRRRTAATKPQLAMGPQKWVVLGPTGLFKNAWNPDAAILSTLQSFIIHDLILLLLIIIIEIKSIQLGIFFQSQIRQKHNNISINSPISNTNRKLAIGFNLIHHHSKRRSTLGSTQTNLRDAMRCDAKRIWEIWERSERGWME